MLSNNLRPAHHINAIDPQWLFPPERAPQPPRNKGCEHNGFCQPGTSLEQWLPAYSQPSNVNVTLHPSFTTNDQCCENCNDIDSADNLLSGLTVWVSPSEDHSAAVRHFDGLISRVSLAIADTKELFESAAHNQSPSSVVNRRYEAWQEALALVRSSEETRSCHQAVLSLEHDTVACKHLRQLHRHRYVVATRKALLDTIRQCTATRVNASIATGIDVAIRRICAECDFCAAPLDAILAKIAHLVVVQDNSSRRMSPACLPWLSAQVMTPLSLTTTTPSSPPSHTHPTSYLGEVVTIT